MREVDTVSVRLVVPVSFYLFLIYFQRNIYFRKFKEEKLLLTGTTEYMLIQLYVPFEVIYHYIMNYMLIVKLSGKLIF